MMTLDKCQVLLLHFTPDAIHFTTSDKGLSIWGHLSTVLFYTLLLIPRTHSLIIISLKVRTRTTSTYKYLILFY